MDSSSDADTAPAARKEPSAVEPEAPATTAAAPKAAVDALANAADSPTPFAFGALKRRTTDAWNSLPKPAVSAELPPFPSISSELPTQEAASQALGMLKRRTTETLGSLQRRTTGLIKNVAGPSVADTTSALPNVAGHVASEMPKWPGFTGLAAKLPTITWPQGQPAGQQHRLPATWERIFVPSLPRSSHSINVVAGNAYIFGGEVQPRNPVDNDMHLVVLPSRSASADHVAIKAQAAPGPAPAPIPTVVEPTAEGDGGKGQDRALSDVDLASPGEGSENVADGPGLPKGRAGDARHTLPDSSALGHVPSPRVGHATAVIGSRIFLFGGRGGPGMAALEERGRVWVFDTKTNLWSFLDPRAPAVEPVTSAVADKRHHCPAARSYHSAVGVSLPRDFSTKSRNQQSWAQWAQGESPQSPIAGSGADNSRDEDEGGYGTLIIHGGCLAEGRANDLWAFDVRSRAWRELPSAPGKPRGGTTLTVAGGKLWRFGGFNGEGEEGGQLDCLALAIEMELVLSAKGEWKSILAKELVSPTAEVEATDGDDERAEPVTKKPSSAPWPGLRSVAGLETVTVSGREHLLLLLGERDPSDDGHNAAGKFWDDVWAYELPRTTATGAATSFVDSWLGRASGAMTAGEGKWFKVEAGAYDDEDIGAAKGPGARGWFATAHMGELEQKGVVLWGGVDGHNSRLGDGWILRLGTEKREA